MLKLHRRDLFRTAAFTAASYSRVSGANDRIRYGLIGAGGRGQHISGHFLGAGGTECVAICDVYSKMIDEAQAAAPSAKGFPDHKELMAETKDLDAVIVATPDHWHAGITIDAANAGLDIYVEKPLTRTIEEGPAITRAVRVNNRVCQVGMQQRSGMHYMKATEEYLTPGKLGIVNTIKTCWHSGYRSPTSASRRRQEEMRNMPLPSNLDWARYLGPVRWREWNPHQYFNFRAYLDFGGGKITDFFAHWGDAIHMMTGKDDPVSCTAEGGVYVYDDGRDAPDTIHCLWKYRGGYTVTFESATGQHLDPYGISFCGTEGLLFIDRKKYVYYPRKGEPVTFETEENITRAHVVNFLDCVRSRKRPNGDVWFGHRGAMTSHLAVMAYKQQRKIHFNPDSEEVLPS